MLAALNAGNIGDENDRVAAVDKTIQTWRCANRGASLQSGLEDEKQWKALLAMMDLIAWRGLATIPQIECYCEQLGKLSSTACGNAKRQTGPVCSPTS